MKKKDIPQDKSVALKDFTREVYYAKNKEGKYEKGLSTGWDIKTEALNNAWEEAKRRVEEARKLFLAGEKSPVYFFMELNLMDLPTLSGYTGFWVFSIKRHFKPKVFKKLSNKKLEKYAKAFKITIDELKNFDGSEKKGV